MDDRRTMDWKAFTIRLIETLRWPLVWAVGLLLLREPIGRLIHVVAAKLAG